jgi:succinate-acetate transporter protein
MLRPIANPLPLGFIALAAATVSVSALQLGWFDPDEGDNVALILIAFVFPLQLVSSIFGYLGRDVIAGTGMGILAGTWLTVGLVMAVNPAGSTSDALGLFLLLAGAAMLIPASAAAGGKVVPAAVLFTTAARFAASGLFQLSASGTWEDIAGVIGLLLCALALYAALALALEDSRRQTLLPLLRRRGGREAFAQDFERQLAELEYEAGVRKQL